VVILKCAKRLNVDLVWGADWDMDGDIEEHKFKDFPHYEISGAN
jgi:peptidoglycan L-alanyl-D-glutamate endopeptidase CwlK